MRSNVVFPLETSFVIEVFFKILKEILFVPIFWKILEKNPVTFIF